MKLFGTLVYAGLFFAVPALAQSSTPQKEQAKPQKEETKPKSDLLAEMQGYRLTRSEMKELIDTLPEKSRRGLEDPKAQAQFVRSWMEVMVLSREAAAQGLDKDPGFQQRLLTVKRELLASLLRERLSKKQEVSDEEIEKYYASHGDQFKHPRMAHLKRIVVGSKEKANEVKKLLDDGKDFDTLIKQYSKDFLAKSRGGDMGWVRAGSAEPAVEQQVFATKIGEVTSPIQTRFGWQIFKVLKTKDAGSYSLAEVRANIRKKLEADKATGSVKKKIDELFAKYDVKIYPEP